MPPSSSKKAAQPSASESFAKSSFYVIWGDDEYSVKKRAKSLYAQWCQNSDGMDNETIDASVSNGGDAIKAIGKLREAMDTLSFFGGVKNIWFNNCNFLGDDRVASGQAVGQAVNELAEDLKKFNWSSVRLILSTGKMDRKRIYYKTFEKIANVEYYPDLSADDEGWVSKAENIILREASQREKTLDDESLALFITTVGPNMRLLNNELEKLLLYIGERNEVQKKDVVSIVTHQKQSRAFELADALGDRDLPHILKALAEAMWEIKMDSQKSSIGILYGLISKIRTMLFLKESAAAGWISLGNNYAGFKSQIEKLPPEHFPKDKRQNPLAGHPYVLFKALPQLRRYTSAELVKAMELLLQCNLNLIFSNLDESLILQKALIEIATPSEPSLKK